MYLQCINDSKSGFVLGFSENHLGFEKINSDRKFIVDNSCVLDIGINI